MATASYAITGSAWTPISTAGQSGSCILQDIQDDVVYVDHGATSAACALTKSFVVRYPKDNQDVLLLTADDTSTDIFYARCGNPNGTATLVVDLV